MRPSVSPFRSRSELSDPGERAGFASRPHSPYYRNRPVGFGRPEPGRCRLPKIAAPEREQRRQNVLSAAWRGAARKGLRDLTIDDVAAEAGVSKGAFYGYFESKEALVLALLEADASALDGSMERLARSPISNVERIRGFVQRTVQLAEDQSRVQVRADLWAAVLTDDVVRHRLSETVMRRRAILRGWIDEAVAKGELAPLQSNALASILLALADGLTLHGALDPSGFRWANIRKALDVVLEGLRRS